MKLVNTIILFSLVSPVAFAKPKGLSDAFKQAIHESEVEKTKSELSLKVEKTSRLSAWRDRSPLVVKVDSSIISDTPVTVLRAPVEPTIDASEETLKAIKEEMKELKQF